MLSHQPLIVPALLLVLSTLTPSLASPSPMAYAGPMSDKQDGWHPVTNTTDSFSPYASPVVNATSAAGSPGGRSGGPKSGEGVYTNTLSGKELAGLVLTFVVLFLFVAGIGVWCFLRQHWSRGSARSAGQDGAVERGPMGEKEGWEKIRDRVDGGGVPKICVEGPVGSALASAGMGSVGSSTMDVLEQRGYANT